MLTLLTTEDFSAWYAALDDATAEDVAAALELLQALGPEREPPGSSELVLWYEAAEHAGVVDRFFGSELGQFVMRSRRALAHLQTQPLQRRLAALGPEQALRASVALERIAAQARRWRRGLARRQGAQAERELRASYQALLEALGLSAPAEDSAPGLRELSVGARQLRVLYGLDPQRSRALLILGERLDKQAYGPSVRRALALWHEFLESSNALSGHAPQVGSGR